MNLSLIEILCPFGWPTLGLEGKGSPIYLQVFVSNFLHFLRTCLIFFLIGFTKKTIAIYFDVFSHSDKESNSPAGRRTSWVGVESGGWPVSVGWRSI